MGATIRIRCPRCHEVVETGVRVTDFFFLQRVELLCDKQEYEPEFGYRTIGCGQHLDIKLATPLDIILRDIYET